MLGSGPQVSSGLKNQALEDRFAPHRDALATEDRAKVLGMSMPTVYSWPKLSVPAYSGGPVGYDHLPDEGGALDKLMSAPKSFGVDWLNVSGQR